MERQRPFLFALDYTQEQQPDSARLELYGFLTPLALSLLDPALEESGDVWEGGWLAAGILTLIVGGSTYLMVRSHKAREKEDLWRQIEPQVDSRLEGIQNKSKRNGKKRRIKGEFFEK